ncbi:MAG: HAD-IB family hydrolase [Acidimicrobiia bacterium]
MATPATDGSLVIAAFDFDGTLSKRDSFLPFLTSVRGPIAVGVAMTRLAPRLGLMTVGRADRDDTKERLVTSLLAGYPAAALATAGIRYADHLATRLRPEIIERLDWHRDAGHVLVLISASPTVYLDPLGAQLGFAAVLATRLEIGPDGTLTGRLDGGNCRGPEKVTRLQTWLGIRTPAEVWAYGDNAGDEDLLAFADHAHHV